MGIVKTDASILLAEHLCNRLPSLHVQTGLKLIPDAGTRVAQKEDSAFRVGTAIFKAQGVCAIVRIRAVEIFERVEFSVAIGVIGTAEGESVEEDSSHTSGRPAEPVKFSTPAPGSGTELEQFTMILLSSVTALVRANTQPS